MENDLQHKLAEAINDEGWTCEAHEPEKFGACKQCLKGQLDLASRIIGVILMAGWLPGVS